MRIESRVTMKMFTQQLIVYQKNKSMMGSFNQYCGIDVGKSALDYCLRSAKKPKERIQNRLTNELSSISEVFSDSKFDQTLFVVEYTGNYSAKILYQLSQMKRSVCVVSPLQSKSFMSALGLTNKNDKQAAHSLSLMGQHMSMRLYKAPSEEMQKRKQLFATLKALEKQQRMLENQLHALAQLPIQEPKAKQALELVLESVTTQIVPLKEQLYQPSQDEQFNEKKKLACSVKGIGEQTAEALLLLTSGLADFEDAGKLSKFLGLTPHSHFSGSSIRRTGGITKFGSQRLRALLYMCANSAIRYNKPCKELFERLRAKGKPYKVAKVAVMHKLVKQVFACVTTKTEFDNDFEAKRK